MRPGDTGTAEIVPLRSSWRRPVVRPLDRLTEVLLQVLGATRWAPPPRGVAWRRVALRLLCTILALGLWISGTTKLEEDHPATAEHRPARR